MTANFDLDNYITVKERKSKFYIDFPDGRIIPEIVENTDVKSTFGVCIYKSREDHALGLPMATGYAQEFKGMGGFANKTSWVENCEESAVGRALDNAGYSGNGKCSREEIIQAQNNEKVLKEHDELFQKIIGGISAKTSGFKDKAAVEAVLFHLGVNASEEIKTASIEVKKGMLEKVGVYDHIELPDEHDPLPLEETQKGPCYRFQHAKFRGAQLKDIDKPELEDYLAKLLKRTELKDWESEAIDMINDYLDNWVSYQDVLHGGDDAE